MELNKNFWENKKVLITGHTGFKGSWLCQWLISLGSKIKGISLQPHTQPNLFDVLELNNQMESSFVDINDYENLNREISKFNPEIIFHLAAQSLVIESYHNPLDTIATNIVGTSNILKIASELNCLEVFVNVTSDKCYENREWHYSYRENDELGGFDVYSSSKACSELITKSFRSCFFENKAKVSTVRAGNVIGGGDWNNNRIISDLLKSIINKNPIKLRNPKATRPWQHVLDPLHGYLILAQKMFSSHEFSGAWNFGPNHTSIISVDDLVRKYLSYFNDISLDDHLKYESGGFHEANFLSLDCSKSKKLLRWEPKYNVDQSIKETVNWHKAFIDKQNIIDLTISQIKDFENFH
jgi:CDP-glucose 4,6-dehydratase